ncbi:hypothetical protein B0I31_109120 [Saccharothrix carnea]|uniref:Secreted protein n=1 Tax=Saccharothrix carnea TaxID=1280637 RepID=A0A2P8I4E8_SACCR|nr:hypothetical protein [Saccharothrix carnea]PSL53330.1 hypothetical protein B0I31_109120 [Saccharothrix carnea]
MRKSIKAAAAGVAAATAMLVATPGNALAYTESCTVQANRSNCSTGNVTANAAHQVVVATYNVQGRSYELRVRDMTNNQVIFSTATSGQVYRTLSNVYATYRAEIYCYNNCPGMMVALWN